MTVITVGVMCSKRLSLKKISIPVNITVAIDAMGGDFGPPVIIPAAIKALEKHLNLSLILVGDEVILRDHLKKRHAKNHPRLSVKHASQTVEMDESPSQALRYKKDSSMRIAINLVKEGEAQACVSAGNTGALMAMARFILRTLPGIDRPAITTTLPCIAGRKLVRVLDLGANVDSSAEHLFQFAVMGSVVGETVDGIESPKVGLLNIGAEDIKGNEQVKQTAALLSKSDALNYTGYIEGDQINKGVVDIVVCDGFVGNVALKSSEGTARLVAHYLREAFNQNFLTKMAGFLVLPIMNNLKKKMDPSRYNGASLVGLQGIVVKSHGGAKTRAFVSAIDEAAIQIEHNVPQQIRDKVSHILQSPDED